MMYVLAIQNESHGNKQQERTGNLFQQKTKAKLVSGEKDYSSTAFFYIHQNPVEALLSKKAIEWD